MRKRRIIVIGLDGVTPNLLFRWCKAGFLPNLRTILKESSYGILNALSTSSAVAWTAHLTGVGPDQNGVRSFLKEGRFIRTCDIKVKTYPELLSERGYKVGLIGFPILYPPLNLQDGFCVSGILTPPNAKDYFLPSRLRGKIDDYEIGVLYRDRAYGFIDDDVKVSRKKIKKDIFRVGKKKLDTILELMRSENWDFFSAQIQETDTIQHVFWSFMRTKESQFSNVILKFYELIDGFLGKIIERYPEEYLVLLSDHGFGPRKILLSGFWESRLPGLFTEVMYKKEGLFPIFNRLYKVVSSLMPKTPTTIAENHIMTGIHEDEGIWCIKGENIRKGFKVDANFLDIPATILYLANVSIPRVYEGQVLKEIFKTEPKIKFSNEDIRILRTKPEKIRKQIQERLKALGYIDFVEK